MKILLFLFFTATVSYANLAHANLQKFNEKPELTLVEEFDLALKLSEPAAHEDNLSNDQLSLVKIELTEDEERILDALDKDEL